MQGGLSMNSFAKMNAIPESTDSYGNSYFSYAYMHPGVENNASLVRFKGVVPQQNGHWGSQIYANHQRIWIGTFKSEMDAAMAYDSAGMKLRNSDSYRNFPWTNITVQEPKFQSYYSTEAILNMIRDGSYQSRFKDFLNEMREQELGLNLAVMHGVRGIQCKLLFQKELTPSDVGKLNRFVIPKKFAVKFFPNIGESSEENANGGEVDDVQLVFYDKLMKLWKFRYCYWKSSKSYVFTRGWNRFVKEKKLKSNDIVAFYLHESLQGPKQGQMLCVIDVCYKECTGDAGVVGMDVDLRLGSGQNANYGVVKEEQEEFEERKPSVGSSPACSADKKGLKLFGVQLI